jgi:epoxyqueuosine reductase
MSDLIGGLAALAAGRGFDTRVCAAGHLAELRAELASRVGAGEVDPAFARERLGHFDFSPTVAGNQPASLIVIAAAQPQQIAVFSYRGREHRYPIPPTYADDTDIEIEAMLREFLGPRGYGLAPAAIPYKLAAARTGLARYGRNNITYHPSYGSYYRLQAYVSDLPAATDAWGEAVRLPECADCTACVRACPTAAITMDRAVIRAERCLTYFNERPEDFPDWVRPGWFRCLVGCLYCQAACPVDRDRDVPPGEPVVFSEDDTENFLAARADGDLTPAVREKLSALWMLDGWELIARNLRELLRTGE